MQLVPIKGAFVTGISEKDVRDICMIRARLEGLAARMAAKNITPELLDAMEETVVISEYNANKEHYEQECEIDSKFHKL